MRPFQSMRLRIALAFVLVALYSACGGGDDEDSVAPAGAGGGNSGSDVETESLDVDNCTLLTDEEVSSLSDGPLFVSEDGPLGCGWLEEGGAIAQFSIRSSRSDASATEHATALAPSLEQRPLSGIGDEAVALISEGEANFIVARKGGLHIEMVMTFLDMEIDSQNFQRAQDLANVALDRLEDAS